MKKGDLFVTVKTQEDRYSLNISFSDKLEKQEGHLYQARECALLQLIDNKTGKIACAYLGRIDVENLRSALQRAACVWFGEF